MPSLDLPRRSGSTARACDWVETRTVGLGWPSSDVSRVVLAIGEAVSNALEHGPPAGGPVRLAFDGDPRQVVVRVADGGEGPATQRLADARLPNDPLATGGRGLYIQAHLADAVERGPDGAVVLTFRPRS